MPDLQKLYEAVLNGNAPAAKAITNEAIAAGVDPQSLLDNYMVKAMDEVGRRFEANEYFVPELLIAARAMKGALEIIRPLLAQSGAKSAGKVAIGTVVGDLHDIGKNLVGAMLEGGGFEVVDLGVNVSPEKFVDAVKNSGAQIVALSSLLTTTMPGLKTTIDALNEAGVRGDVKVMVGGAPVTQSFANDIGADGYSDDASSAVRLARSLVAA
ncbi:MAG TPA: corrinoid protein [Capsulimonadaceae bacterium]|jgi:corrinoid protein of di/trimethylamine methyltransferase